MESFSKFDLDGNGQVPIEEFAFSIMERLDRFTDDEPLLDKIALDIMPAGNKSAAEVLIMVYTLLLFYH